MLPQAIVRYKGRIFRAPVRVTMQDYRAKPVKAGAMLQFVLPGGRSAKLPERDDEFFAMDGLCAARIIRDQGPCFVFHDRNGRMNVVPERASQIASMIREHAHELVGKYHLRTDIPRRDTTARNKAMRELARLIADDLAYHCPQEID